MPFQRTETITCKIEVKDTDSGAYTDPATSMTITITDPDGTTVVDAQTMTKDATGQYHYDYTPGGSASLGKYTVRYIATDGSQVTIEDDSFVLEA